MIVETRVLGRDTERAERELALPPARQTLREVLAVLVRAELEQYSRRRDEQLLLRVLTPADFADAERSGRLVPGGRAVPAAPTADVAVARALEAFRDGLYLVLVDGRQVDDLDDELSVTDQTRLRLVRLVALAGG